MLFNSALFFGFFACFFGLYWLLARRVAAQNVAVLAGSWLFYGWWDERFLILIALSTACDYVCGLGAAGPRYDRRHVLKAGALVAGGALVATAFSFETSWPIFLAVLAALPVLYGIIRALENLSGPHRRKGYLIFSLTLNLGLLGVFKYFGFFTESFIAAFESIGFQVNAPLINIILPVGISFYTFQTLSYTIDIYRKQMQPTRALVNLAAYVAFFPQLVAGPIERARNLLPQFEARRVWSTDDVASGALLFAWGLYKKIVIADNLAPITNAAFADPAATAPAMMVVGILAFAFQIYCDFSGYSDMARGLARMLGFRLMLNFNLPYFSRTPSEFWRRWHISLSSWLRDYLYIPLGGNKRGRWLTYRNLALTMLLGGLWHGAAWTFIVWGAFHGAILCLYRALQIDRFVFTQPLFSARGLPVHVTAWAVMSVLTLIGWTFFRAETLEGAVAALATAGAAFTSGAVLTQLPGLEEWGQFLFYVSPLIVVQIIQAVSGRLEFLHAALRPGAARVVRFAGANGLLFVLCALLFLSAQGGQEFLYFDF